MISIAKYIGGILFDFDGVIIPAGIIHRQALNEALAALRHPAIPDSIATRLEGMPSRMMLAEMHLSIEEIDEVYELKKELSEDMLEDWIRENPEYVEKTFEKFCMFSVPVLGKMAIVSNCNSSFIHKGIKMLGLQNYFRVYVTNDAGTRMNKPAINPWLWAAGALGLHPSNCVAVEDKAANLVEPAKVGMLTLLVQNPEELQVDTFIDKLQSNFEKEPQ